MKKDVKDTKKEPGGKHNPNKFIELNPDDTITNTAISESANKTAVFTFGRFNPPTIGHEKLVNRVLTVAKESKGVPQIYISHSQDKKKNPLTYDTKMKFMKIAFGPIIQNSSAKNVIDIAKMLDSSFDNLILVVGADRKDEFKTLLNKYNGKEYNYKSIEVISAGDRDPDADDISGMSGSKMRTMVLTGNLKQFKEGLPEKLKSHANEIYNEIKKGMGLMENFIPEEMEEEKKPLTQMQRRQRGLIMRRNRAKLKIAREKAKQRMATPDKLKVRAMKKAREIIRDKLMKSKKYSEMTPAEKIQLDKRLLKIPHSAIQRIAVKQLPLVRKAEVQRLSDLHKSDDQKKNESLDLNSLFEERFLEQKKEINELFEQFVNEPGIARRKKFRYLYTREGKVNCDQRFKMFRPKQQISESELFNLIESVEELSEGPAVDRVSSSIETEKAADKNRHQKMLTRAKEVDKLRKESVDKTDPKNREYGTKTLVAILRGDTPGEDLEEARVIPPLKHSPTTVKDYVEPMTPDLSVVVSKHNKHHLGIGLNLKQMVQHALKSKDTDSDGDVDTQDLKPVAGGELTADPSFDKTKNTTQKMQKKYEKEKTHTKPGLAFESKLEKSKDDPCWKGYAQLGMKKKGNRDVPNCVPVNESEDTCPILTVAQMKAFEQFVDKMFAKFNIDFEFTKHFRERMSHERNDPCINMKELADMIKKIYAKYQHGEKSLNKFVDAEAVIKDMQTNLNMPIAVEYDRKNDELDVIAKTIMRKKNFRTPNPEIKV